METAKDSADLTPLEFVTVNDFNRLVRDLNRHRRETRAGFSRIDARLTGLDGALTPERLDVILGEADQAIRSRIFRDELRRRLHPATRVGAAFWTIVVAVAAIITDVARIRSGH